MEYDYIFLEAHIGKLIDQMYLILKILDSFFLQRKTVHLFHNHQYYLIVSQFQTEINLQDLLKLNQVSNRSKKQKVSKIFYY
jgi:hypothetical protein